MNENGQPFSDILDSIIQADPIPIHLLYNLSDLSPEEHQAFKKRFASMEGERRRVIIRHLVDICEEDFTVDFEPIFINGFEDPSPKVRAAALDGVWDSSNYRIISRILEMLEADESVEVQTAAASALAHFVILIEWGQLPDQYLAPISEGLLAAYEKPGAAVSTKRAALEAIGTATHPRVAGLISDAYESDDPDMQLSAVFAMGNSADKRWVPILLDELENPLPAMRSEAARAAGSIGDAMAVPVLSELIADEETEVAKAAVYALGQIGGESANQILLSLIDEPDYAELQESIHEAIEEISWLSGAMSLLDMSEDEDLD